MGELKDQIVRKIGQDARDKLGCLSKEFVYAKSEDKDGILAEMEFQKDMADMSEMCFD